MMPQSSSEEKKKLTECLVPIPTGERGALARGELGVTSNPGGSPAYAVLATSRNCRILSTAKCASAKQGAADIVKRVGSGLIPSADASLAKSYFSWGVGDGVSECEPTTRREVGSFTCAN